MGSLHRSASEGMMRMPGGMAGAMAAHTRSGSGGVLQEERPYRGAGPPGPEQAPGLLLPRNIDTPDFAMIYAFLGSMFDPVSLISLRSDQSPHFIHFISLATCPSSTSPCLQKVPIKSQSATLCHSCCLISASRGPVVCPAHLTSSNYRYAKEFRSIPYWKTWTCLTMRQQCCYAAP